MYLSISLFSEGFSEAFCENKSLYFRWKRERNNSSGYVAYEAISPTSFIDYSQMKALPGHWDDEVDKRLFFLKCGTCVFHRPTTTLKAAPTLVSSRRLRLPDGLHNTTLFRNDPTDQRQGQQPLLSASCVYPLLAAGYSWCRN